MSLSVKYNDFQLIMINCLNENNDIRTDAEDKYEKVPVLHKIEFLLKIISERTMARDVLQLCAVLLRRMFFASYDSIEEVITPEILEQIKNQILLLLKNPQDASLLKKMCEVAAELAKRLIDERNQNHWPELLKFMFECVNSQDLVLKECALNLLALVPGIFGNELERYLEVIRQMLYHCLTDNNLNLDIRTAAVKATSAFILHHETDKKVYQHLSDCAVPMIHLIVTTISLDGEHCDTILKAVTDIAEKCPQFLRARTEDLIQLCLEALRGADIVDTRKHLCIEIVISLAENAPQTIRKRGTPYLGQLVSHLLLMMTTIEEDPEWGNVDVIEEDDFESNNVIGETSLDRLACSVGGKTILPLVLETISTMLQNPDWRHRFAAMMAVSAVGEGCHDQMLPMLPKIVSGILPFLSDAHPRVRYAACNALGQMASDFAPDFQEKFHNVVVPSLLTLLDDQMNPRVQAHAGAALVNFFEECPPKIVAIYLEQSAAKLEVLINMKINELMSKGTKLVLEQAVVTLASLADSAQEYFERYYDKFVPCLKAIIKMATTDELKILRGKAIECISLIGLAVGRDRFCADASEVMDMLLRTQTGEEQLAEDDPQLAYMISAWARICKILGSQFEPYLPYVMPPVLKAASYQIQMQILDDDDTLVEKDWSRITLDQVGIKTSGLEDKATALQMLVCYARELKQNFANYVEDVVKVVVPELKFLFHDGVRTAAAEILPYLLESAKARGKEYVNGMWKYIFPELMHAIETETEREVLSELMASLDTCITDLGREFISDDQLEAIVKALDEHLKQYFVRCEERSEKRKDEDYDEGVEETLVEEDDEDVFILSKVADVVHACFSVCKDYFLRYFDSIVHHFVKLAGSDRAWTEQHWAICVMDDVIEHGGPRCEKYKDFFIPLLVSGVQSTYPEIRQASAYGWGVLARFGGPNFASVFSACVTILVQMIQAPDAREVPNINATENAIAAITKILQYNSSQVNVNELLPIWFSWLPVWEDEEELPHVYGFLLSLIEHNHPIIMGENNSNLPRIVYIFMEVLARNAITLSSEVGQKIIALMNSLKNDALLFQRCVESLNTQHQECLKQVLAYPGDGQ